MGFLEPSIDQRPGRPPQGSLHQKYPLLLGSLLGGVATQLLLRLSLNGALGFADGGGTGDGGFSEVRAVSRLGGGVGNVLVGPV